MLPGNLPAALEPEGLEPYLQVSATGVQIYICSMSNGAWAWTFKAPEALLLDQQNKQIGKALSGGRIVGAVKTNAPGGAGNIPWLLLDVKSRAGSGVFTEARGILRIDTVGGVAPPAGCDEAHADQEARVPYTANYVFLK